MTHLLPHLKMAVELACSSLNFLPFLGHLKMFGRVLAMELTITSKIRIF